MAHVQDRWWRDKKDPKTDQAVFGSNGKPLREKTERHGKGDRYRVRYKDPQGKDCSRSFPDKQLSMANEFKIKIENDLLRGKYRPPDSGSIKVRAYGLTYLKGLSQVESSQVAFNNIFKNHIFPFLGDYNLDQIGADLIREWRAWLNRPGGVSVNFQAQIWTLASSMMDAAVIDEKIHRNPFDNRSISRPKPVGNRIAPWATSKLHRITEGLPERERICVPIGAGLGLRQGEIFAFSMDDVDRKKMVYVCRRQLVYLKGALRFKLPKGHKIRTIPLGEGVLENLDHHVELYPPVPVTLPWDERDGRETETANLLMTTPSGGPWLPTHFRRNRWLAAFVIGDLAYERKLDGMHALRHLFASHMLAQGVSIKELAAYLGHSSEAFTLRTYVHLMPSSFRRARLAANALFPPRSGPTSAGLLLAS
ncbi:site-specific integrase [Crossiella sp. SN42]|uniref:tyrosine-type recombinase/integrase n=1 Tax=Crossiella sp. SN42 TaxID=2944808 RepID=UPI00207D3A63|nr:tyrosine-type recombinase/integrase [Crossiella sp. SN42]MCO1581645.1 site-specific integrase [Crossiella sp. SN42]